MSECAALRHEIAALSMRMTEQHERTRDEIQKVRELIVERLKGA